MGISKEEAEDMQLDIEYNELYSKYLTKDVFKILFPKYNDDGFESYLIKIYGECIKLAYHANKDHPDFDEEEFCSVFAPMIGVFLSNLRHRCKEISENVFLEINTAFNVISKVTCIENIEDIKKKIIEETLIKTKK
jgi:hypothetical protein